MRLSDVVGHSGLAGYAEVALVLFVIVFAAVLVRTLWPSRRADFDQARQLPFESGDESLRRGEESPDAR